MAERNNELAAEKENSALKKLQAAAGFSTGHVERLDWMYEQSACTAKPDNDKLMNMPVAGQKDQDMEDVKKLQESTAGSLFLKSATKTTEDMKRKLREDPLFQIRQQEQAAKINQMANPLIMAKMRKKEEKLAKKAQKKAKKVAKKEKKAAKKAAKAEKKLKKKNKKKESSSSSSSSASSAAEGKMAQPVLPAPVTDQARRSRSRQRSRSPKARAGGDAALGPSGIIVDKREEHAARIAAQRDAALASRGAARLLSDEEKKRRVEEMQSDAKRHEASKDKRIAAAMEKERQLEEADKEARNKSDQKYFRDLREKAYMGNEGGTVADRLQTQRHRRQKHINDPLERDG